MKFIYVTSFLCFISGLILAQNLYDSAYYYQRIKDYDKAIQISHEYLKSNEVTDQQKNDIYFNMAYCFKKKNQPTKAIKHYLLSIESYEDDLCNAKAHYNIGNIYKDFHLYKEAIGHYNEAILLMNDEAKKGKYMVSRAIAYKYSGQHDLAIQDVLQAEQIASADMLNRKKLLFLAYSQHGLIKKDMEDFDLAIKYFQYANGLNLNINDHINLGKTYHLSGDLEKAIVHYEKALLSKQNTDQQFKTYQNLGELYQSINEVDRSIDYLKKGEKIFAQLQYPESEDIDLFNLLAKQYKASKNEQMGFKYLEKTIELLKDIESKKQELLAQYEKEKISSAEQEFYQTLDQERKTQHLQSIGIICAAVALLMIGIAFYLLKRRTRKTKIFKQEVDIIRKRVEKIYSPSDNFNS